MKEIIERLTENRQLELAKSILENAGYKVTKKINESEDKVNIDDFFDGAEGKNILDITKRFLKELDDKGHTPDGYFIGTSRKDIDVLLYFAADKTTFNYSSRSALTNMREPYWVPVYEWDMEDGVYAPEGYRDCHDESGLIKAIEQRMGARSSRDDKWKRAIDTLKSIVEEGELKSTKDSEELAEKFSDGSDFIVVRDRSGMSTKVVHQDGTIANYKGGKFTGLGPRAIQNFEDLVKSMNYAEAQLYQITIRNHIGYR